MRAGKCVLVTCAVFAADIQMAAGQPYWTVSRFEPSPVCRADFDRNGSLDWQDVDAFVQAFERGGSPADFNADWTISFEDFDAFVIAFERGCLPAACNSWFADPVFPAGRQPVSLAAGDFDGDGLPDIVTANFQGNGISILRNTGCLTLGPRFEYSTVSRPETRPNSVAVGDVDGDGVLDVVVNKTQASSISIFRGRGDGTFLERIDVPLGASSTAIALADMNSDGRLDVVAISGGVAVLRNLGAAAFSAPERYSTGTPMGGIRVADINNDGRLDVVTAIPSLNEIAVLFNSADGTLSAPVRYSGAGGLANCAIGDFDADGWIDVAAGTTVQSGVQTISVYRNDRSGGLLPRVDYPIVGVVAEVQAGDIDGDGDTDIVATATNTGLAFVLRNSGAGTFAPAELIGPTGASGRFVLADMDQDGLSDIVAASRGQLSNAFDGSVIIRKNLGDAKFATRLNLGVGKRPTTVATGDINGDGVVDIASGNSVDGTVSVILGLPAGGFAPRKDVAAPVGVSTVRLADINKDGLDDMCVTRNDSRTLRILFSTESGAFQTPVDYLLPDRIDDIMAADVSGDGRLDLVAAGGSTATLLVSQLDGTLVPQSIGVGLEALSAVATSDINRDGLLDVVVASYGKNRITILLATPSGTWTQSELPTGTSPWSVAVGDLNNDGWPDIVAGNTGRAFEYPDSSVSVYLSIGGGAFGPRVDYAAGSAIYSATIADFDHDGWSDIAVMNNDIGRISILRNTGQGVFGAAFAFAAPGSIRSALARDMNGDSFADLVVAHYDGSTNNVSVFFNQNGSDALSPLGRP